MKTRMIMKLMTVVLAASGLTAGTLTWDNDSTTSGIQDGDGTWDTTNTNWWDGVSNTNWVSSSSVVIGSSGTGGTITLSGTHTVSNMTFGSAYTLTNGTITLAAANTIVTNNVDIHIASVLAGASKGIVKKGSGTLYLEGANTYTGNTVIDQGTLTLSQNYSTTLGSLSFGAAVGSVNYGNLDLSSANATFIALATYNNNATGNTITIGNGKTLTVNGNVTVGYNSGSACTNALAMTGSGTLYVNKSGGSLWVGSNPSANTVAPAMLDMSTLATNNINLGSTGNVYVQLSGGSMTSGDIVLKLATNSTITAGTVSVGNSGPGGNSYLKLGSGTNILNANTLVVAVSGRGYGYLQFNSGSGTVKIRGADGTSGAALNMVVGAPSTGSTFTGDFDVSGHSADLLFSTVKVMELSNAGAAYTSNFRFDTGTLTSSLFNIGTKTGGGAYNPSATVNIGSGTGNYLNTANLGVVNVSSNSSGAGTMKGFINIAGNQTTVSMNALTIASSSVAGGTATGAVTVASGVTLTMNGDILRGSTIGTSQPYFGLSNATLRAGANFTVGSGLTTMALPGNLTLDSSTNTMTIVGNISGSGNLTKTGTGGLLIYGAKTGTGALTVSAGYLGGTNVWAGTVTNLAVITAGDTNTVGSLTVSNLVLAADSTFLWNYDNTNSDVINVTGTLTLPAVATVQVSRVSGKLPSLATLATYNSLAGNSNLQGWKVVGDSVQPRTYVRINNKQVQLVSPTGTLISIL
ncbi:MAG: autotransporter-associated beta strand repeat-containing protein [bacterium]